MSLPIESDRPLSTTFSKLAGLQNLIPQFDNNSAVTAKYFIDTVDNISEIAQCTPNEKLLLLKSKIRGDALSQLISSHDLSSETDYNDFKSKFLDYFGIKSSLASRQQNFSNCTMKAQEPVKNYASRVCNATHKFFGDINVNNEEVKALFEQTKLLKFIEGLSPEFKRELLIKDPQTFQEALNFVELLQNNERHLQTVANVNTAINTSQDDLLSLLIQHKKNTDETIASLSQQIETLQLKSNRPYSNARSPSTNRFRDGNSFQTRNRSPQPYFDNNSRSPYPRGRTTARIERTPAQHRNVSRCDICHKTNHITRSCFYNTYRQPQYFSRLPNNSTQHRNITGERKVSFASTPRNASVINPSHRPHYENRSFSNGAFSSRNYNRRPLN